MVVGRYVCGMVPRGRREEKRRRGEEVKEREERGEEVQQKRVCGFPYLEKQEGDKKGCLSHDVSIVTENRSCYADEDEGGRNIRTI